MPTPPTQQPVAVSDARLAALQGLVEYAGLFPPAALDMAGAVAGYRTARASTAAFMLGRFICPASRLAELAGRLASTMAEGEAPWRVSVLLGTGDGAVIADDDLRAARDFGEMAPAAAIETAEIALPAAPAGESLVIHRVEMMARQVAALGPVLPYFEVPLGTDWQSSAPRILEDLATARRELSTTLAAKIRCGGVTADRFPTVEQVALFITTCRDLGLPFKATAGLHNAFRHVDPATGFTHHGFVNVLAAAVLAQSHLLDAVAVCEILADTDGGSFSLTRRALRWRDLEAERAGLEAARESLFAGYGSCDFDDPAGDLTDMGVLPLEAP